MTPIALLLQFWPTIRAACRVVIAAGGLLAAIYGFIVGMADLPGALNGLKDTLDGMTTMVHGLPTHAVMAKVNRIFPLTEFLGLFLGYVTLLVAATLVRWIKAAVLFWSGG